MSSLISLIRRHLFFLFFIFSLLSLIFLTYKDYGIAWDEKVFINVGKYYLISIFNLLHLSTNLTANGFVPTPYHTLGHGAFYDVFIILASFFLPKVNFETIHLLRALSAVPIFILVYWIVSRLLSKIYGLIAIIFLLLFPRFYPDIFYNAIDIPTALFFTICLAYFIYYAKTKQTVVKSVFFGFLLAITINQRLLLFYLPLLNAIFLFFNRKSIRSFLTSQFFIFTSLLLFLHLTHPYLLTHPVRGLFDIIYSAKQYPWNAAVLFDGQFYQAGVSPLPWYYLPKTMLITIPPIFIFLFIVGCIRMVATRVRPHSSLHAPFKKNVFLYCLATFFTPFILNFILKPTLYDSWRHFMFLTVPIVIMAIFGLDWLLDINFGEIKKSKIPASPAGRKNQNFNSKLKILNSFKFGNWNLRLVWKPVYQNLRSVQGHKPISDLVYRLGFGLLVIIGLVNTIVHMARLHPYEYLYYNSLTGGLNGAYGKYETDYLGLGYKDAVLWFNTHENNPSKYYYIFVEGDPLSSTTYFKPNMVLTTNPQRADYIFTFTRWNFHERYSGKIVYILKRDQVPLIFIKKQ